MSGIKRVLPILLVVFATISISSPVSAAGATKLTLDTSGSSRMQVYVDKRGRMKLETVVGAVVDPGDHHSYGYSEASEMYIKYSTPEEFRKSNFWKTMNILNRSSCSDPWRKRSTCRVVGLPATKYTRRLGSGQTEELFMTMVLPMDYKWVQQYVVATGGGSLPPGFPLKDVVVLPGGKTQRVLECTKVEQINVAAEFFKVPKGYKQTSDDWQVYLGGVADSLMYQSGGKK